MSKLTGASQRAAKPEDSAVRWAQSDEEPATRCCSQFMGNRFKASGGLIHLVCDPAAAFPNCHNNEFNFFLRNLVIRDDMPLQTYPSKYSINS